MATAKAEAEEEAKQDKTHKGRSRDGVIDYNQKDAVIDNTERGMECEHSIPGLNPL